MVDNLFEHELRDRRQVSWSSRRALAFGAFAWAEDAEPFLRQGVAALVAAGVGVKSAEHVVRLYGAEYRAIVDLVTADPRLTEVVDPNSSSPDIAAQVVIAVVNEAACTLSDIVDRRLTLGTVGPMRDDVLTKVAAITGPLLGWDMDRQASEVVREVSRRRSAVFSRGG
jgi:glycerol-3-phosphate dehydrogenase